MNTNFKGFAHFLMVLVLASIAFVGIGYYAYKNGYMKLNSSNKLSQECGVCGRQGLHNPDGKQCTPGLECISSDSEVAISGNLCVKPGNSLKKCLDYLSQKSTSWKTYRNEDGEFSFNYPHDAGLFENKIGATVIIPGDKPVGESMSNSFINLTFETVQKDLQSIEGIARLNYMQVNPETSEIISKLRNTEVNGHNGYMYKVRDKIVFGFDTTYTYLESPSKQNYVVIVSSLEDNDKLGYQKLHDQILSTFKFSD